jgi:hypothetical protein
MGENPSSLFVQGKGFPSACFLYQKKGARGLRAAWETFFPQRRSSPKSSTKEAPTPEKPPKKLSSEIFFGGDVVVKKVFFFRFIFKQNLNTNWT